MWRQSLLFLVFCVILPGCVARESASSATSVPETTPAALTFNAQVAAMPEGTTQYFAESPFGPALIESGTSYFSGLGEVCRSARILRGEEGQASVLCQDANGVWRFFPSIFESMPR